MCELYLNKKGDLYVLIGNNLQDTIITWKKTLHLECDLIYMYKNAYTHTHNHTIYTRTYTYICLYDSRKTLEENKENCQ